MPWDGKLSTDETEMCGAVSASAATQGRDITISGSFRGAGHERSLILFMNTFNTKRFAVNALLAAMCAVLGAVSLDMGNLKITFESLPVLIGALMFGPLDGLIIGGIGTLLYQVLRYGITVTTPLWILPYLLCGLMAGAYARRHSFALSGKQLAFIVFAAEITVFVVNTGVMYIDSKVYGYYSFIYVFGTVLPRVILCLVKAAAFTAVLPALMKAAATARRGRS